MDPVPITQACTPIRPMTPTAQDPPNEWDRLAAVLSLAEVVARHVNDFTAVDPEILPEWLDGLGVPAGWRLADLEGGGAQPSRIAVHTPSGSDRGLGCETIGIFRFTGIPPVDVVRDNADCTLRALHSDNISTQDLAAPPAPGVAAVRSSGYFDTAGLRVWAQYSTYIAGFDGLLILHNMFIESSCREKLHDDVAQLSNAVHHAFLATISTTRIGDNQAMSRTERVPDQAPRFQQFGYDTTGLRGKKLRVLTTYPTDDAGADSNLPAGITDVVAVDDTPNVTLSVQVHPIDDPTRIAFVAFDQLALYTDE